MDVSSFVSFFTRKSLSLDRPLSLLYRGILGQLDSFIGPGATAAEVILQFGAAFIIGYGCLLVYHEKRQQQEQQEGGDDGIPVIDQNSIIAFLLGIDMIGGTVTNSTSAAKRWFHRSGQTFKDHMAFIGVHAMQIFVVSYFFAANSDNNDIVWKQYFATIYGLILLSSIIVLSVPLYIQRPTAMTIVAASVPFSISGKFLAATPGLEWFVPLLFLKLLVSHLTYETPFQPHDVLSHNQSGTKKKA